jgi:hypothetical protein
MESSEAVSQGAKGTKIISGFFFFAMDVLWLVYDDGASPGDLSNILLPAPEFFLIQRALSYTDTDAVAESVRR